MRRTVRLLSGWDQIHNCIDSSSTFQTETVFALYGYIFKHSIPRLVSSTYVVLNAMCEIRNAHPEPTNHFRILKRDLPASPPEGKLIGFMHRHPPGFLYPSENDLNGIPRGFVGLVWCEQSVHWYDSHGLLIPVDLYGYFNQ